jgi:hypothetical protein
LTPIKSALRKSGFLTAVPATLFHDRTGQRANPRPQ